MTLTQKYLTSTPLIADIRSLDYTSQASVVKAFVEMLDEIDDASENYLVDRYLEDCECIDFDNIEESLHHLHLAVNDMDNVIADYDYYDPMTFYDIADRLDKVMTNIKNGVSSTKKRKTRKSSTKKSTTSSPTPPPRVLMQMEKAIALLNQQQGTNTTLDDFDILPIELDDSEK